ncbi:TIGR03557 family F420-dependent LLM class oxidoreductase [Pseudactinotalea sp. Z1748]|uniref:TIGR03557 family F420-dependent LLM class oxidoreductase n=1 Tax=Pseudactinotalea sp. Z1748 TaxID=3413027 RepID=UPI003C7AE539
MGCAIGYSAMLAQFPPAAAVALSALAQEHGFTGTMAADHFQPWVPAQGQAPFVWNVLTAIAERTSGDIGPGVTAPTFRYHPAVVAQASATLAAMYPGRHWLGLGSGEALNEHVTGQYWPEAPSRIARLFEAIEIIRRLFTASAAGRDAKFSGEYFQLESSRLWTMPEQPPPILVAASGPVTARRAGARADGLITQEAPPERLAMLLARFAEGAREAGKDPAVMPKVLQVHLSWAPTDGEALDNAMTQWPTGAMRFSTADVRSPFTVAQMARMLRPEDFEGQLVISSDPDVHRSALQRYIDLGFDRIYLHNVGRNQAEWIEVFGAEVLPALKGRT